MLRSKLRTCFPEIQELPGTALPRTLVVERGATCPPSRLPTYADAPPGPPQSEMQSCWGRSLSLCLHATLNGHVIVAGQRGHEQGICVSVGRASGRAGADGGHTPATAELQTEKSWSLITWRLGASPKYQRGLLATRERQLSPL